MRRHITLVLGSLLLVGLAGCSEAGFGGDASASNKEAGLKYAQCMRENGVPDFPDPTYDDNGEMELALPAGVDPKTVAEPQEKCKQHLPVESGGEPPKMDPENLKKVQAYATCMRENGISKFQDPDSSGALSAEGLDPLSPEFKAVHEKCAHHMPSGGGGVMLGPGGRK